MSFLAKLNIDGEEFVILDCNYETIQKANDNGLPSNQPKGGKIFLLLEANAKVDFFEWVMSGNAMKDGHITFFKRDNISSFKTLDFSEAYCLEYHEHFHADDGQPLKIQLTISAKEMNIRGIAHSNNWPYKANIS